MEAKQIIFKSTPEYWNKESLGLKRNTLRQENPNDAIDDRFVALREWMCAKVDLIIGIKNTETGDIFFREVKDVSKFDDYYIISW